MPISIHCRRLAIDSLELRDNTGIQIAVKRTAISCPMVCAEYQY